MHGLSVMGSVLMLLASGFAAAAEPSPRQLSIWADMRIGVDGRPLEVAFPKGEAMAPELRAGMGPMLMKAQFEPVLVDGAAVEVRTPVLITLEVLEDESGAQVRIAGAVPSPRPVRIHQPKYPDMAQRNSLTGQLRLRCTVTAQGRCGEIEVESEFAPTPMVRSAMAALKHWEWDVPEAGGAKYPVEVIVPFAFQMRENMYDEGMRAATWMRYQGQQGLSPGLRMPTKR